MDWMEILANPIIGNLLVLLAAIIGIGGSYLIYRLRLKNRKNSARRAIKSELESMTFFPQWIEEDSRELPAYSIGTTTAYESHIENIGLLNDFEIDKLTKFYSSLINTNEMLNINSDVILRSGLTKNTIDSGRNHRENVLTSRIDQLAVWRWQSLQILKKNLDEEYDPPEYLDVPKSPGEKVYAKHPIVQLDKNKIPAERYFEPVDDNPEFYQLTKCGEARMNERSNRDIGF